MNGLKLAPNWAAIAQILGGALAAPDGQYAQGAQVGAQNYQQMAGNRELMDMRRQDAQRDQQRYDDEKRYRDEIRAREAREAQQWAAFFPQLGTQGQYGTAAGIAPMGSMDAGQRRSSGIERERGGGHGQDPSVLKAFNTGYAGSGPASDPFADLNLTPQDRAFMAMAGRTAGLDYLGKKLAASGSEAPKTVGGMYWDGDSFENIPGYTEQQSAIAAASRNPQQGPVTWSDVKDAQGNVIAQRSSTGELNYFSNTNPKPPTAADLRGEYTKATKDYEQAAYGYSKVVSAANNPSGAGDIALIFGFMKTIDPTSTVREGEFATAQQTAGIPGQVVALYNKALSGERLTPEQRADFAQQAANQFQVYQDRKGVADQFYTGLAQRNNLSPQDVLMPFPDLPTYNPPVTPDVGFRQGAVKWERGPDGTPRKVAQ